MPFKTVSHPNRNLVLLVGIPEPIEKLCDLSHGGFNVFSTRTQILENSGHDRTDRCSANVFRRSLIALPYAFLNEGRKIEVIARSCAFLFAARPFCSLLGDICCELVTWSYDMRSLTRSYNEVPSSPSMNNAFRSFP